MSLCPARSSAAAILPSRLRDALDDPVEESPTRACRMVCYRRVLRRAQATAGAQSGWAKPAQERGMLPFFGVGGAGCGLLCWRGRYLSGWVWGKWKIAALKADPTACQCDEVR